MVAASVFTVAGAAAPPSVHPTAPHLSHAKYQLNGFRESTPPHNSQLVVYYKQKQDKDPPSVHPTAPRVSVCEEERESVCVCVRERVSVCEGGRE